MDGPTTCPAEVPPNLSDSTMLPKRCISQDLCHLPCGQAIISYRLSQVLGLKENLQILAAESLTAADEQILDEQQCKLGRLIGNPKTKTDRKAVPQDHRGMPKQYLSAAFRSDASSRPNNVERRRSASCKEYRRSFGPRTGYKQAARARWPNLHGRHPV
jgi:hypothetical protein